MTYRRFFNTIAAALLCSTLFCGFLVHFVTAEVVHAYRKPNESDLQWLLGDVSAPVPEFSGVVQVGFVTNANTKSTCECTLTPRCEPCKPIKLPKQPIPPAPTTTFNKKNTGITPDEDGVVNIAPTIVNSAIPVVQMSNKQLPPPSEVPKEQNIAVLAVDSTAERLPIPNDEKIFSDISKHSVIDSVSKLDLGVHCSGISEQLSCRSSDEDNSSGICLTCIICGDHRKNKQHGSNSKGCTTPDDDELTRNSCKKCETVFYVPDMIGSSAWFSEYKVGISQTGNFMQFTLPTMLLTKPNVAEHFNAEVQNRIWADYRHWNNAVSINHNGLFESRAVEQFSFGLEKRILKRMSLELCVPVICQFASNQTTNDESTSAELGNVSVFLKQILKRNARWTLSGGVGAMIPTAENWRSPVKSAQLNNNLYYLTSFLGVQWHPNKDIFGHFVVQHDLPIEKNELVLGSDQLNVEGQQMIRAGAQLGYWIYRNDYGKRPCRLGSFVEVDYAVVTDGTAQRWLHMGSDKVFVSTFDSRKSTLMAAVGMPMMFGKLTCTNSVILPISGCERPFSVGYNFSLSRLF